jgi:hypothetical protein
MELIEQCPAAGIGQGLEDCVHREIMQPIGYMSILMNKCNQIVANRTGEGFPR